MIEQYPYVAVTAIALLWAGANATLGETRLDWPPDTHVVHTPAAGPIVQAATVTSTVVRSPIQIEIVTTTTSSTTTTLPGPPAWTGPLPEHYGAGSGCTPAEATIVAHHMWDRGASDDTVEWMLATISRESTCDPAAHNGNRNTGDDSYGLCQINALAGWFRDGQLLDDIDPNRFANDFEHSAYACATLWAECGRGPWNYGDYYCRTPDA